MKNDIELEIIKKFVDKDKQERIIWELGNAKKRENIMLMRFAGPNVFLAKCLQLVEYMPSAVMEEMLLRLGGTNSVYYMGLDYIGELTLKEAVAEAHAGDICIIYCGNGVGYYQGEQVYGKPPRFLLLNR